MTSAAVPAGPAVIGLVDWGVGGLGVLARIDEHAPGVPVVYWSDTGAAPYGTLAPTALADRLRSVVAALAERGCTEVVLACNAASTVVGRLGDAAVPVEGIIAHGIAAVPDRVSGLIGVVGGARTVRSGAYRRGLARADRLVRSRVAQPLSGHIESGRVGSPELAADLVRIVAPLRGASAVVLACTHYPAASEAFAAALPGTVLVDPADHLARSVADRVGAGADADAADPVATPAARVFVTTGDPRAMVDAARSAWGRTLPGRLERAHL